MNSLYDFILNNQKFHNTANFIKQGLFQTISIQGTGAKSLRGILSLTLGNTSIEELLHCIFVFLTSIFFQIQILFSIPIINFLSCVFYAIYLVKISEDKGLGLLKSTPSFALCLFPNLGFMNSMGINFVSVYVFEKVYKRIKEKSSQISQSTKENEGITQSKDFPKRGFMGSKIREKIKLKL